MSSKKSNNYSPYKRSAPNKLSFCNENTANEEAIKAKKQKQEEQGRLMAQEIEKANKAFNYKPETATAGPSGSKPAVEETSIDGSIHNPNTDKGKKKEDLSSSTENTTSMEVDQSGGNPSAIGKPLEDDPLGNEMDVQKEIDELKNAGDDQQHTDDGFIKVTRKSKYFATIPMDNVNGEKYQNKLLTLQKLMAPYDGLMEYNFLWLKSNLQFTLIMSTI